MVFFSVLILILGNIDQIYAGENLCESVQDGPWEDADTWNPSCSGGIPGEGQFVEISHDVTISTDIVVSDVDVEEDPNGILTVKKDASLTLKMLSVDFDVFNHGTITITDEFRNGAFDTFHNECTGVLNLIDTDSSGNGPGALFINHGIININTNNAPGFENDGIFQNSGIINPFEKFFNDDVDGGTFETVASPCVQVLVGGNFLPIDTTSLLLAGAQMTTSWLIPVIVAGLGFAIVIARKV